MEITSPTPVIMDRWSDLRNAMKGAVITPADIGYDHARQAWNLMVDQHPAVIVIPENGDDIVAAVHFARRQGLGIAVQATGHGNVRPADDALLILTRNMQALHIDAFSRRAWVGAGVQWGSVLAQAQAFGLAPLLGSAPAVGAVGYTLGGGFGWLGRKYGLSIDNVNYFEVVTADGRRLIASENENADLFWGLCGGGGALGVITGMEIKLFPVTDVYAGNLYYPIEQARDVFTRYREWIADAPDELTSSILVCNYPPFPELPAFLRGQTFAQVRGCYCGPIPTGETMLQYWREWQPPLIDDFKAIPFTNAAVISNDPVDPSPGHSTAAWVRDLNDNVIDALIAFGSATMGSPLVFAEIRHAGGAIARQAPDVNAYGNRASHHLLQLVGITPTKDTHRAVAQFSERFKQAIGHSLTGGVYLNFLEGQEAQNSIQAGFTPDTFFRLQQLKRHYDPDNRLGYSFNILPA